MRRRAWWVLILALPFLAEAAPAGFTGRWVDDLKEDAVADHDDAYLVANGTYRCESCSPPRAYPADGRDRPVSGDAGTLSESVTVIGPRAIRTHLIERDMVRDVTMTVSDDDATATYVAMDRWPGHDTALRTVFVARRVAFGPPGAHPVSGTWKAVRYVEVPEEYRSIVLEDSGTRFTRSTFRYGHYTAEVGGPPVPVLGLARARPVTATVSAPDPLTRVETVYIAGTAVTERTYRLSADGTTLETHVRDPATGEVFRSVSRRR